MMKLRHGWISFILILAILSSKWISIGHEGSPCVAVAQDASAPSEGSSSDVADAHETEEDNSYPLEVEDFRDGDFVLTRDESIAFSNASAVLGVGTAAANVLSSMLALRMVIEVDAKELLDYSLPLDHPTNVALRNCKQCVQREALNRGRQLAREMSSFLEEHIEDIIDEYEATLRNSTADGTLNYTLTEEQRSKIISEIAQEISPITVRLWRTNFSGENRKASVTITIVAPIELARLIVRHVSHEVRIRDAMLLPDAQTTREARMDMMAQARLTASLHAAHTYTALGYEGAILVQPRKVMFRLRHVASTSYVDEELVLGPRDSDDDYEGTSAHSSGSRRGRRPRYIRLHSVNDIAEARVVVAAHIISEEDAKRLVEENRAVNGEEGLGRPAIPAIGSGEEEEEKEEEYSHPPGSVRRAPPVLIRNQTDEDPNVDTTLTPVERLFRPREADMTGEGDTEVVGSPRVAADVAADAVRSEDNEGELDEATARAMIEAEDAYESERETVASDTLTDWIARPNAGRVTPLWNPATLVTGRSFRTMADDDVTNTTIIIPPTVINNTANTVNATRGAGARNETAIDTSDIGSEGASTPMVTEADSSEEENAGDAEDEDEEENENRSGRERRDSRQPDRDARSEADNRPHTGPGNSSADEEDDEGEEGDGEEKDEEEEEDEENDNEDSDDEDEDNRRNRGDNRRNRGNNRRSRGNRREDDSDDESDDDD